MIFRRNAIVSPIGRKAAGLFVKMVIVWAALGLAGDFQVSLLGSAEIPKVKIGLLLPPDEPQGRAVLEGVLLARDHANASGTNAVEVFIRGRDGQWGADGVEAARMIIDDAVDGLIAPSDGAATHLALQVSGRTQVPVVSLCPDGSIGRTGVPWNLRLVACTEDEGMTLFQGIGTGAATHYVAIVPGGRAGREISSDLARAAHNCKGISFQTVEAGVNLTNLNGLEARVLEKGPRVVLLWLPPKPAGAVAKALRERGFKGLLAGPCYLNSGEFIQSAGNAFEGVIVPCVANETNQGGVEKFKDSFRLQWHHEADEISVMSYDAVMLLSCLMRRADFSSPPHRLSEEFCWTGVSGLVRFNRDGNRKARLSLMEGHNRAFRPFQSAQRD